MQEHKDRPGPGRRVLLVVAAFVVLAGVGAIYVMGSGSGNVASSECGKASTKMAALKPLALGDVAAFQLADAPSPIGALGFTDGEGTQKNISDWRGKTVLLNLWATWCAPCRHEMPALETLQREMGGERFSVVPVSVDLGDDAKPKAFYAETGLKDLPFFHDGSMGIFNALKKRSLAIGMPTTLLVDEAGCHVAVMHGPAEWDSPDGLAVVDALLAE